MPTRLRLIQVMLGGALLCLGGAGWGRLQQSYARNAIAGPQLIVDATARLSAADRAAIRDELAWAPLNAYLLNQWLVDEAQRGGLAAAARSPTAAMLAKLGYRRLAAQQNLMLIAGQDDDAAMLVDRLDAVLRRGKMRGSGYRLAAGLEASPHRALLVERIARNPDWASDYLRYQAALSSPAILAARLATVGDIANPDIADRAAYATASSAAMAIGPCDLALAFDRAYHARAQAQPTYAAPQPGEVIFPFDWHIPDQPGSLTTVTQGDTRPTLNLAWDGRGNPVLAWRYLRPAETVAALETRIFGRHPALRGQLQLSVSAAPSAGGSPCALQRVNIRGFPGPVARPLSATLVL